MRRESSNFPNKTSKHHCQPTESIKNDVHALHPHPLSQTIVLLHSSSINYLRERPRHTDTQTHSDPRASICCERLIYGGAIANTTRAEHNVWVSLRFYNGDGAIE